MKRALASVAGLVGIAALGRWLSRRRHTAEVVPQPVPHAVPQPAEVAAADPAEELRRKLADQRPTEPVADAPPTETLDERRARVHAKAREAIDAMGDDGAGT